MSLNLSYKFTFSTNPTIRKTIFYAIPILFIDTRIINIFYVLIMCLTKQTKYYFVPSFAYLKKERDLAILCAVSYFLPIYSTPIREPYTQQYNILLVYMRRNRIFMKVIITSANYQQTFIGRISLKVQIINMDNLKEKIKVRLNYHK